jgi:hypothetical protein
VGITNPKVVRDTPEGIESTDTELRDRESQRPEGRQGGDHDDDVDDAERQPRATVKPVADRLAGVARMDEGSADERGNEQHLQDIVVNEGTKQIVRNDGKKEAARRLCVGTHELCRGTRLVGRWTGYRRAEINEIAHRCPDEQCDGGHRLKIDKGLEADAPDLAHVAHLGDAGANNKKYQRGDAELDERNEDIGQRFDRNSDHGPEHPDGGAGRGGDQNLYPTLGAKGVWQHAPMQRNDLS